MGDTGNALLSAIAITSALYHRDRTGQGQQVGTSIVNAVLLHTSYAWIHDDGTPGGWDHIDANQTGLGPYYRMYETADDRWIFVDALEHAFRGASADDWSGRLDAAAVPAEIVDEEFCRKLFDDPHARADQLVVETWAGGVGRFEDPGLLVTFGDTPGVVPGGPCRCGEHTRELLFELGYTADDVDRLAASRAVLDAPVERR
jgi:crotonobetainyl-CoA:carnitine CoA-transferase CaiB-like acyl-CoA transferase